MTDVIYTNKSKINKPKDQIIVNKYYWVEMKPAKTLPIYQFKLHPQSNLNGVYVLVKDDSKIIKHLKSGEKVEMLYHSKNTDAPVEQFKTQILNIAKKEQGPLKGHFKVALSIVD